MNTAPRQAPQPALGAFAASVAAAAVTRLWLNVVVPPPAPDIVPLPPAPPATYPTPTPGDQPPPISDPTLPGQHVPVREPTAPGSQTTRCLH